MLILVQWFQMSVSLSQQRRGMCDFLATHPNTQTHKHTQNSLYSSNKSRFECVESWPQFTNNKHTIFCPGALAQCKCFDIISTVARKQHSCRLYIFIKIYWHIRRKRRSTIIHIRQFERMFSHAINNAICMCCSALSHGLSKSSPNPNLESSSANKTQVVA